MYFLYLLFLFLFLLFLFLFLLLLFLFLLLLLPIALRPFQLGLGFLMVFEQYSFPGWGCQSHAHPQLSWRTDDFLSGLSPLADQEP